MLTPKLIPGPRGVVGVLEGADLFTLPLLLHSFDPPSFSQPFNGCGFRSFELATRCSAVGGGVPRIFLSWVRVLDPLSGLPLRSSEDVPGGNSAVVGRTNSNVFNPAQAAAGAQTFTPALNVVELRVTAYGRTVTLDRVWLFLHAEDRAGGVLTPGPGRR